METFIFLMEIAGTIAFSVSGALIGIEKKMDIFGVTILGLTTAVGGGVIRDLIIGSTPPQTFQNPVYAMVAIIVAVIIFLCAFFWHIHYDRIFFELLVFVMDSLGLGIFTVVGISTAYNTSHDFSNFLLIFVGVITGVGGGVLRDMLAGNTPYIFVKHVYACASLAGAILCVYLIPVMGLRNAMFLGMTITVVIRFLSRHYRWNLPRMR